MDISLTLFLMEFEAWVFLHHQLTTLYWDVGKYILNTISSLKTTCGSVWKDQLFFVYLVQSNYMMNKEMSCVELWKKSLFSYVVFCSLNQFEFVFANG